MKFKTVPALPELRFSVIGFGCWSLGGGSRWDGSDDPQSIATVHRALDLGINFFDTAPVYGFGGSELLLGDALRGRRDAVILASKCGLVWDEQRTVRRSLSAATVRSDVEASLRRLRTDRLDLLQLHWPDHATPLEETAEALQRLLREGKILRVGVTNFSIADTEALSRMVPVSAYQGLYNLLERNPTFYHAIDLEYLSEAHVLPFCRDNGLAFFPYSPLMQGLLTGSFSATTRFSGDDVRSENPKLTGPAYPAYLAAATSLRTVAEGVGLSLTELALAWLCDQPAVTSVICGAQDAAQISANAAAADVALPDAARQPIAEILARLDRETA